MAIFTLGRGLSLSSFQGFPVSTSGSRPAVAERPGAKTQLTGVTGAVLIILTRTIDSRHFFPAVEAAVSAFRDKTGADWTAADVAGPDSAGPDSAGTAQPAVDPTARP